MAVVLAWLWNERFWFPVNVTWADLEQKTPEAYRVGHLLAAFPLAAGLLVLRHFFERRCRSSARPALPTQTWLRLFNFDIPKESGWRWWIRI
uniref:Uncharacterized protein n=1 Tax=Pseudonaja textilis TaxID=8673 RepID=A0A670ZTC5_PSETE